MDECGVCDGDNTSCSDCAGIPNGEAYIDGCEGCVGGTTELEPCTSEYFGENDWYVSTNGDDGTGNGSERFHLNHSACA